MPIQVKKELEIIRKKEEKIVFRVGRFKVRRKLFFSILLSVLVAVMTFNKVRVLHESGQSISNIMLAITSLVCFVSLYLAIIRKNPYYSAKQIGSVFMILMLISLISTSGYSLADLAFISMIITTVALLIYDVF